MPYKKKPKLKKPCKVTPENDIGPPYRWLGILIIVVLIGLFVHEEVYNHPIDREYVYMSIAGFVAAFGLIRPEFLDTLVKSIVSKLPGFSYHNSDTKDGI